MASLPCLVLLLLPAAPANVEDEPDDLPAAGRPAGLPFTGASGKFTAALSATPATLVVESTVTLTLEVRAAGPVVRPPGRVDLRKLAGFRERFHIEDFRAGDDRRPGPDRWEFVYRLRPRQAGMVEIPDIPFVFLNPALVRTRHPYEVRHTGPIRLAVRPQPAYPVALEAPERFFHLAAGADLLAAEVPWRLPGPVVLVLGLLVPPLASLAVYGVWRRLNPDAVRLAGMRRSRAARQALSRLDRAARLPARQQAALAASAVAGYLHGRFDLAVTEPTPTEAGEHLRRAGCAVGAEAISRFLQSCDAVRFQANGTADACDLAAAAGRIILAVETESCPPSS